MITGGLSPEAGSTAEVVIGNKSCIFDLPNRFKDRNTILGNGKVAQKQNWCGDKKRGLAKISQNRIAKFSIYVSLGIHRKMFSKLLRKQKSILIMDL